MEFATFWRAIVFRQAPPLVNMQPKALQILHKLIAEQIRTLLGPLGANGIALHHPCGRVAHEQAARLHLAQPRLHVRAVGRRGGGIKAVHPGKTVVGRQVGGSSATRLWRCSRPGWR